MTQKYLVTLQPDANLDRFLASAKLAGCLASSDVPPIPMKGGESVVTVEGPADAFEQLKNLATVRKVNRSSAMELH